jgi:predicted amidophosphoribosyltransferase
MAAVLELGLQLFERRRITFRTPTSQASRPATDSMRVNRPVERPDRITIVDDVVTKGATLLAGASLLREAFPDTEVRVFALVRTRGLVSEIDRIVDPVVGTIRNRCGGADREP